MNKALLEQLREAHPDVQIVMASKYIDADDIPFYYDAGIEDFGESRVEGFLEKHPRISLPIRWHFLGTLQTKKVKKIINAIDTLHSLDRLKLAREIQKRREQPLSCYVQVNISKEPQKHGVAPEKTLDFIDSLAPYDLCRIEGLMGMASYSDKETVREEFRTLRRLRDEVVSKHPQAGRLSMGMSEDYDIALEEGADVVRLGRILISEDML